MKTQAQTKIKDAEREHKIYYEIIVDCYDEGEQKMGWYYYMEENLQFPFEANIIIKKKNGRATEQIVEVLQLSSDEDFGNDMLVEVCYNDDIFDVPLLSLKNIKADGKTIEAIEDWKYWDSK